MWQNDKLRITIIVLSALIVIGLVVGMALYFTIGQDDGNTASDEVLCANGSYHIWNNGEITVQPTSTSDGAKKYTCSTCGKTKTVSIRPQQGISISSAAEFAKIGKVEEYPLYEHYKLTCDINLGDDWVPLGTTCWAHSKENDVNSITSPFRGTLDGQGHTITYSTTINGLNSNDSDYAWGLFGTSNGATFKNIVLNATINSLPLSNNANNGRECAVGGIVGLAYQSSFVNCMTTASSSIVNSATDCTWYTFLIGMEKIGVTYAGGIVGDARNCTFTSCSNGGTVESHGYTAYAGGIVGNAYQTTTSLCVNGGLVKASAFDWEWGDYGTGYVFAKSNEPWLRANGGYATT